MSDHSAPNLDLEGQRVRIEARQTEISKMIEQSFRLMAEGRKLDAENRKLDAEAHKLSAEALKLAHDTRWAPALLITTAVASIGGLLTGTAALLAQVLTSHTH